MQRKSLLRQYGLIRGKLTKQYEAIEGGAITLDLVGERIRELQGQLSAIKERLEEIKANPAIPLHLFRAEALERFQVMIKEMFVGEDRVATKAYLKLFIEKIVIDLPRIDITCKTRVLLAVLENKTAARTGEVLTADYVWLPSADSNHGPDG